jgi:hypothetical protein
VVGQLFVAHSRNFEVSNEYGLLAGNAENYVLPTEHSGFGKNGPQGVPKGCGVKDAGVVYRVLGRRAFSKRIDLRPVFTQGYAGGFDALRADVYAEGSSESFSQASTKPNSNR